MGSRYLITGIQLGLITSFISSTDKDLFKVLNDIEGNQFVYNSDKSIEEDVHDLQGQLESKK